MTDFTWRDKEQMAHEANECVRTNGDFDGLLRKWIGIYPAQHRQVVAGMKYVAEHARDQMAKEAAEKAAREALLADDIAVVEGLLERLPALLSRLRAAEKANGQEQ